MRIYKK